MSDIRLAILNDCECPEPRMVIAVLNEGGRHEWAYVSAWGDLDHHRGWRPLKFPDRITDLETFGVCPVFEIHNGEFTLHVEQVGPSRAKYSDGQPRRWQAQTGKRTVIHETMLPTIIAYSRQARTKQAEQPK